jgi:hypothetical protein
VSIALSLCVAGFFATPAFAQGPETIDKPYYYPEIATRGAETLSKFTIDIPGQRILEHSRDFTGPVMRLPSITPGPGFHALGVYHGSGYITAVFDTPEEKPGAPGTFVHHIQAWGAARQGTQLIHDAYISGGPGSKVRFYEPRRPSFSNTHTRTVVSDSPARPPWVFISIMNTTDYDDVYSLGAPGQPSPKLFSAWDFDLVNLANDEHYEIVAWQRMTYDLNCNFLVESEHSYPEVYGERPNGGYRKIWPPSNWKNPDPGWWHAERGKLDGGDYQVQGTFADLRSDKKYELIAIVNRANAEHTQWLAAYELTENAFVEVTAANLPSQKIAFMINQAENAARPSAKPRNPNLHVDTTPHVILRAATPDKCSAGGTLDGDGTSRLDYHYYDGHLYPYHRNVE